MKNILNYFYHIIIDEDRIDNGYFSYLNHLFLIKKYQRSLDEIDKLLKLNIDMINKNIKINKIIYNIYNNALTIYDNNYYVLLMVNYRTFDDNFKYYMINNKEYDILKRNNWDYLWSMKIDYVEYQVKHLTNKYPIIEDSINYYIGLSENAIKYFKLINKNNESLYIEHRRINKDNIYDPLEIVIDYKVRDISEYIKYNFFNSGKDLYDIKNDIKKLNLNNIDYLLLYSRMLYPSFYFDLYDRIINNNEDENIINDIINKSIEYEELLYEIYLIINRKYNIMGIDWINKKYI